MEARNLPNTEFETMVIRILKEVRVKMNDLSENLEIVSIKKDTEPGWCGSGDLVLACEPQGPRFDP